MKIYKEGQIGRGMQIPIFRVPTIKLAIGNTLTHTTSSQTGSLVLKR